MRVGLITTLIFLAFGAAAYLNTGTEKALTVCSADPPSAIDTSVLAVSIQARFSITEGGFSCSYYDTDDEPVMEVRLGIWP